MQEWEEVYKGVYRLPNVISEEECDALIESIKDSWWDVGPEPVDGLPLWQTKSMGEHQCPDSLWSFSKNLSLNFLVDKISEITGFDKEKLLRSEFWPFMRKYQNKEFGRDSFKLHPDPTYFTALFLLTDPETFEGGEFIVKSSLWSKARTVPMKKGDCVFFEGKKKHGVNKVVSGIRHSLNFFFWETDDEEKVYLTKLKN